MFKIILAKDLTSPTYSYTMNCDETTPGTNQDGYRGC